MPRLTHCRRRNASCSSRIIPIVRHGLRAVIDDEADLGVCGELGVTKRLR
jgi:hypothetical protein